MKKFIAFLLFLIISIGVSSCGDENKSISTTNSFGNYSLNLNVKTMRNSYINFSDIGKIILDVNSSSLDYVVEQPFIKVNGKWAIDLIQLPMDKDLTFKARAFIGSETTHSYINEQILKLVEGENNITMALQEVDTFSSNKVLVQSMETAVSSVDDVNYTILSFYLFNNNHDDLNFTITADPNSVGSGGGFFAPDDNDNVLEIFSSVVSYGSADEYTLDINYSRPAEAGTYKNRLKLINTNGDIFIYVFNLTVNDNDEVYVKLNAPAEVENFIATSEDTNLSVEVNATDPDGDNSALTYLWTLSNDSSNKGATLELDNDSATTKTAIVTGYDDDDDIVVLDVNITDANGSITTARYTSTQ